MSIPSLNSTLEVLLSLKRDEKGIGQVTIDGENWRLTTGIIRAHGSSSGLSTLTGLKAKVDEAKKFLDDDASDEKIKASALKVMKAAQDFFTRINLSKIAIAVEGVENKEQERFKSDLKALFSPEKIPKEEKKEKVSSIPPKEEITDKKPPSDPESLGKTIGSGYNMLSILEKELKEAKIVSKQMLLEAKKHPYKTAAYFAVVAGVSSLFARWHKTTSTSSLTNPS